MLEKEEKTEIKEDSRGIVDYLLGKAVSRKLLVWVTATTALFMEVVPAEQWMMISLTYIGGQAVVDAVKIIKARTGE